MIINPQDHSYFYLYSHNRLMEKFGNAMNILRQQKPDFKIFNSDEIVRFDLPKANEDERGFYGLIVVPNVHNYKNIGFLMKEMGYLKPKKKEDEENLKIKIIREYFSAKTPSNKLRITFLDEWDMVGKLDEKLIPLFQNTSPMVYRHDRCLSLEGMLLNNGHNVKESIEYAPRLFIRFYDIPKK